MSASLHTLQDNASGTAQFGASPPGTFDFEQYFLGHTYASGWFADRFGRPRRHFFGNFYGHHGEDVFLLDETLHFNDGVVEERQWRISLSESGEFAAESESLINGARGQIKGDTLSMQYAMKVRIEEGKTWDLDMKDKMILQPDGILHNITQVCKWGVRIGTVSAQYHRKGDSQIVNHPNVVRGMEKRESSHPRYLHDASSRSR